MRKQLDSPIIKKFIQVASNEENYSTHLVKLLSTGDEALLARIHLIRAAKKSIDIKTFIWANDESGRYIVYELLEAARRGIKVRILIDGWVTVGNPALVAFMCTANKNIQTKHYNPPAERIQPTTLELLTEAFVDFYKVNHRMHNKAFIVDDEVAIIGGRNVQNDYFDRSMSRNFLDRDLLMVGPEVKKIANSLNQFWESSRSLQGELLKDLAKHISPDNSQFETKKNLVSEKLFKTLSKHASDNEYIQKHFAEHLDEVNDIEYIADEPRTCPEDVCVTHDTLCKLLKEAKNSITIESPYLVLDDSYYEILLNLRKTKPDIRIITATNSLAATDNVIAYAHGYRERYKYLSELQIEIYELKPIPEDIYDFLGFVVEEKLKSKDKIQKSLANGKFKNSDNLHLCEHAKTYVIDNSITWIGSPNVDPRSGQINSENGVIIRDKKFSAKVEKIISEHIHPRNSWVVGLAKDTSTFSMLTEAFQSLFVEENLDSPSEFRIPVSFEPKNGQSDIPFYDSKFYDTYESVGPFPLVEGSSREIQVRLISFLPEITKELI